MNTPEKPILTIPYKWKVKVAEFSLIGGLITILFINLINM